jgi:putative hydrolase of the HAD superfamily
MGETSGVLRAVLFDWGETLFHCDYDDALHLAGWRAGLAAAGLSGQADPVETAAAFRARFRPLLDAATEAEADYEAVLREALAAFGLAVDEAGLRRFVAAEHGVEMAARRWAPDAFALLSGLREIGLSVGIVSNACDPGWVLEQDVRDSGLGAHVDAVVFSSVVGVRKPFEPIFRAALTALGVHPRETLFVGDRRHEDVGGAAMLGMTTVLATWFRHDPEPAGPAPDHVAAAPADVLRIALELRRTTPSPAIQPKG